MVDIFFCVEDVSISTLSMFITGVFGEGEGVGVVEEEFVFRGVVEEIDAVCIGDDCGAFIVCELSFPDFSARDGEDEEVH